MASKNNVFWEALVLTVAVFLIGIFIGISYEANKIDEINEYYALSEISLLDTFALGSLDKSDVSCDTLIETHIDFANRIYDEALLLEKYEESGKLTEGFRVAHKKYDLMRTLLWINTIDTLDRCEGDFSTVVYLYEVETEDLTKKAQHRVWSRILFDLKQEKGNEIILIPIAVDSDLTSLNILLDKYSVEEYPAVLVNNEEIIYEISSVDDLREHF